MRQNKARSRARSSRKVSTPHNNYFQSVVAIREVAVELLQVALPIEQFAKLNLATLQLAPSTFIDSKLRGSLSDLIYTCEYHDWQKIRVCILLEHKREKPTRALLLQLLRYLLSILEEDEKQRRKEFTLTIPIVFYHGTEAWEPKFLRDLFAHLPAELLCYVPDFDFQVVNVQAMSDAQIEAMHHTLLLRNILLAMKHTRDDNFYRQNFGKVVIFEAENVREDILKLIVQLTAQYILYTSTIQEPEIMELTQTLPSRHQRRVKTTGELIEERGYKKGKVEAMEQFIKQYLLKYPKEPDEGVAYSFKVPLDLVKKVRKEIQDEIN